MSTVNNEPTFGQPQVNVAVPGMPTIPNIAGIPVQPTQPPQPQHVQQTQPTPAAPQMHPLPTVGDVPGYPQQVQPMQQPMQQPMMQSVQMPGQMPQQELPTIQDNNPTAEMPNSGTLQEQMVANHQPMPGMVQPQQIDQNMLAQQQAQMMQQLNVPQQMMGQAPAAQQSYNPQMQQVGQMQYPQGYGQQMPGMPGMAQMPQSNPGMMAPGAPQGSYIPGGNLGSTPTGHPEKQKFQAQARLIYAKNRPTKKGTFITTGLMATNMNDRNAPASNFVCFSGSAAKQIDILENPQVRSQYTTIEKLAGQIIQYEGSWEWNTKGQIPGWQVMIDNFYFVNDPQLRNHAETFVPPVPVSPMDMLMGGNMQGQQMYNQQMPGMAQMPQQGYPQQMPGMMNQPMGQMPQQQMPGMAQMSQQGYPQQMPGMPGMPGMAQ